MPTKFEYPLKRSPKTDPQQYRVYRMENEAIGARSYFKMTRDAQRKLIRSVCKNYAVPRAKVIWADLDRWAAEWQEPNIIRLNTAKGTSKDLLSVTHELAHHVHYWLAGKVSELHASHGPEFMAVHMSILDTLRIIPVVGMRAICKAWKVRHADPGTTNSYSKLRRVASGKAT